MPALGLGGAGAVVLVQLGLFGFPLAARRRARAVRVSVSGGSGRPTRRDSRPPSNPTKMQPPKPKPTPANIRTTPSGARMLAMVKPMLGHMLDNLLLVRVRLVDVHLLLELLHVARRGRARDRARAVHVLVVVVDAGVAGGVEEGEVVLGHVAHEGDFEPGEELDVVELGDGELGEVLAEAGGWIVLLEGIEFELIKEKRTVELQDNFLARAIFGCLVGDVDDERDLPVLELVIRLPANKQRFKSYKSRK